ncbi:DeoR/GlpR family DNA-binding transcription regulator [Aeriscardovia aeriphila]|uniref:DeoR family transcriptional regulator n=1 Tax=Aeriscardovia aeriphila TaxID=218139 RepID=A0A261FBP4_9BIFI|nr:DeoR/GlpR family DNA-binding transcription regulator [Aeriscardovia aeriphila]NYI25391.1 DeoR/GlpR family transcriptional regulator of sugar metabolism [Aeriscardovia aeriphila]OZG56455.1 DeoR family transcriptional regulator [Aeriscardovia aeriphila]
MFLLSRLRMTGSIRIAEVSRELNVSSMTIRRDIVELEDQGLVRRVHGGAVAASALLAEPLFSVKSQFDVKAKDRIAQKATEFVHPGDVVAIGGGTTAYIFAQRLFESEVSEGLTVLTNSVPVAELGQSAHSHNIEVIATGGVLTRSSSMVGPMADRAIKQLRVNSLFLGTHSVALSRGFLTPNTLEASTNKALISIADRSYILADHTKWHNTSLTLFASFSDIDCLITDADLPQDEMMWTKKRINTVVVSDRQTPAPAPAQPVSHFQTSDPFAPLEQV